MSLIQTIFPLATQIAPSDLLPQLYFKKDLLTFEIIEVCKISLWEIASLQTEMDEGETNDTGDE